MLEGLGQEQNRGERTPEVMGYFDHQLQPTRPAEAFGDHRPARTTIQAAKLPGKGLRVEIDCIAYIP